MTTVRTVCSPLACALVFLVAFAAEVSLQTLPALSGKWRMNHERSEDAKKKLEEALRRAGFPGPRPNGVDSNSDWRVQDREQMRRRIEGLIEASETLDIRQDGKGITVIEGNMRERKFYTDGRPYQREDRRGNRTAVRSRWRGERLVVDTNLADGGRFTESYELAPEGRQLIVTFTSSDRRLKQPLVIQRVYEPLQSAND